MGGYKEVAPGSSFVVMGKFRILVLVMVMRLYMGEKCIKVHTHTYTQSEAGKN